MAEPVRAGPEFWPHAIEALLDEWCDGLKRACPCVEDYFADMASSDPLAGGSIQEDHGKDLATMHDPYDRSSKWLIERRGDAILYLGGIRGIQSWRSLQADVVQPRRLPDGLLEVYLHGCQDPDLYLVEIATYPENRVPRKFLRMRSSYS
jgi:hypothetical protein